MNCWFFLVILCIATAHAQELPHQATHNYNQTLVVDCSNPVCHRWDNFFYESSCHSFDAFKVTPITELPSTVSLPQFFHEIVGDNVKHTGSSIQLTSANNSCCTKRAHKKPILRSKKSPKDHAIINTIELSIAKKINTYGVITCCNTTIVSRLELGKHFYQHHHNDGQKICCPFPECDYVLCDNTTRLAEHYIQEHFIKSVFACPSSGCEKEYKSRAGLLKHLHSCKFFTKTNGLS